jgi:chemotaxis family two-component system response regulator PixH
MTDEAQLPTVMIVDDVRFLRELAALFLGRTSHVVACASGAEALEAASREAPGVIVSDYRMPEMSGVELCRTIRRDPLLAGTPFIMLVSDLSGAERGQAVRGGADDVLSKPLSRLDLIDSVRRLLRSASERSMPRVEIEVPISVAGLVDQHIEPSVEPRGTAHQIEKGVVRNLSRGGMFVETDCDLSDHQEVTLQFRLPDSSEVLTPSAQVVWERRERTGRDGLATRPGFGLRFLEIDGATSDRVGDYVYERTGSAPTDHSHRAAGGA